MAGLRPAGLTLPLTTSRPWEEGGPSDFDNLVPLCRHHHIQVHHRNWKLRLDPTRQLEVTQPDGRPFATTQPNRRPRAEANDNDSIGNGQPSQEPP